MAEIDPTVQQINDLYSQQLKQQKAQLEAQRNKAVLEEQQKAALIAPKYTASKQQANVQSQLGAKNFAEYLAQRGMTNFGISGQAELSRQNALANQIQGYNTSQAAEELASNQNIAGYNTLYNTEFTNAQNTVAASKAEALLNYAEQLRQEKAKVEEQKRQEQLAAEQDALEWNRTVAEQKRQEQVAEEQAISAWNRQLALKKLKSSSSTGSSILTDTSSKSKNTSKTSNNNYNNVLTSAKYIYTNSKSDVRNENIQYYLTTALLAGDITENQLKTIINELGVDNTPKTTTTNKTTTNKTTANKSAVKTITAKKQSNVYKKPQKITVGNGIMPITKKTNTTTTTAKKPSSILKPTLINNSYKRI